LIAPYLVPVSLLITQVCETPLPFKLSPPLALEYEVIAEPVVVLLPPLPL
jgi:hypothetical protein